MMIGAQFRIAWIACMPKIRFDPRPDCQKITMNPNAAPSEIRFRTTALSASGPTGTLWLAAGT